MEGDTGELEIDSELVMSFYDQCHADDLYKVAGVNGKTYSDDMIELKAATPQVWNLPDLLVGLDGIGNKMMSHSPPPPPTTTTTIPTLSHKTEITVTRSPATPHETKHSFLTDSFRQQTDSLLEGLGILGPSQMLVKTETCTTPPPSRNTGPPGTQLTQEYNSSIGLELEMAATTTPFVELMNLTPKTEPCDHLGGENLNLTSAQEPHHHCTLIHNLQSLPAVAGELGQQGHHHHQILNVTIPAQYRGGPPPLIQAPPSAASSSPRSELITAVAVATQGGGSSFTITNEAGDTCHSLADVNLDTVHMLQEEEESGVSERGAMEPGEANPSYKRCHLCVRIFSTKANLSSHIRHVHLGEAKHSRVKSIPCPHCQKMFSRKGHMTEHVRTVHEGKKRIYKEVNCQHCGKTFRRKWGLNIHISSAHADVVSTLVRQ